MKPEFQDGDARLKSFNRSARERIVQAFSRFEDAVYVGLGLVPAAVRSSCSWTAR